MKTVLTVVGARPQFIKAAPLSRLLRERFSEYLLHTGQHYDREMSDLFFGELGIPAPDLNLEVGSSTHADQTSRMRAGIAAAARGVKPGLILVYGDTNSTLAGALAAAELGIPLAHVEAGLRSDDITMPEEVNRIAADHLSDLCLCPTDNAVQRLEAEGVGSRARRVGDVMLDACLAMRDRAGTTALERLGLEAGQYSFATIHRPANTDRPVRLASIAEGLGRAGTPVVFPVHPRTRSALALQRLELPDNVIATDPVSYGEVISLLAHARIVITDSGGLQKEAYFLSVPCVTVRDTTEWPETTESGWNVLVPAEADAIADALESSASPGSAPDLALFGEGRACERIVAEIRSLLC